MKAPRNPTFPNSPLFFAAIPLSDLVHTTWPDRRPLPRIWFLHWALEPRPEARLPDAFGRAIRLLGRPFAVTKAWRIRGGKGRQSRYPCRRPPAAAQQQHDGQEEQEDGGEDGDDEEEEEGEKEQDDDDKKLQHKSADTTTCLASLIVVLYRGDESAVCWHSR